MSKKRQFALSAHLTAGTHHFGTTMSLVSELSGDKRYKGTSIELIDRGLIFRHEGTKKKLFVPYSNVKSIAIPFDSDFGQEIEPFVEEITQNALQLEIDKRNAAKNKK